MIDEGLHSLAVHEFERGNYDRAQSLALLSRSYALLEIAKSLAKLSTCVTIIHGAPELCVWDAYQDQHNNP
jgi:hypothetical protein